MTGSITFELAAMLIAFGGGVLLIWWRIEQRIKEGEKESQRRDDMLHARISEVAKELVNYKLAAAQQFASHEHLKEVEVRLTDAIGRLTNRIEQLPTKFAEEVARIVDARPSRR